MTTLTFLRTSLLSTGNLVLIDFIKSVDSVYKDAKMLQASIRNSRKIDRALGAFIDLIFYTIVACVILSQVSHQAPRVCSSQYSSANSSSFRLE
jgi:hypothetical protein